MNSKLKMHSLGKTYTEITQRATMIHRSFSMPHISLMLLTTELMNESVIKQARLSVTISCIRSPNNLALVKKCHAHYLGRLRSQQGIFRHQ